jgi:hypothetical protein
MTLVLSGGRISGSGRLSGNPNPPSGGGNGPPPEEGLTPPDGIPGLVGWYDATYPDSLWADEAGTVPAAIGGFVARWDDRSSNGFHVTQSTASRRPVRQINHVYFDGTDDRLLRGSVLTSSQQYTAVFVGATNDVTGARYVFLNGNGDGSANGWGFIQSSLTGSPRVMFHAGVASNPADGSVVLNAREIWVGRTGTANSFRLNGVSQTLSITDSIPFVPTDRFQIGGRNATDRTWSGQMSAVLLYDRELTVSECEELEDWLSKRHKVSLSI